MGQADEMPSWCLSSPKSSLRKAVKRRAIHLGGAGHEVVDARLEGLSVLVTPSIVEQICVIAAAGRANEPRIIPGGKDDRRVHAPVGSRAQRTV